MTFDFSGPEWGAFGVVMGAVAGIPIAIGLLLAYEWLWPDGFKGGDDDS